ncbi:1-acyl-sn-glycerol-3-phosphate acyltransferase [Lysinibacillus sp. FSL H8-0500]|uniref:lysophospholipid acyltransferase family protein n=1 Tax=Lysinibacillus sp. FSL H8-0500 TaxID=2921393 RepID=UPI003100EFF3
MEIDIDFSSIHTFWRSTHSTSNWLIEDIYTSLYSKFVHRLVAADTDGFATIQGKPVIYVANHQTAIESMLFCMIVGGLTQTPICSLAKMEHQQSWLGQLISHSSLYPGYHPHRSMILFDRRKPRTFLKILKQMSTILQKEQTSLLIHVDGTRAISCREASTQMNRNVIKLAIEANVPIVPVRFTGGLPVEPLLERIDFPVGYGCQDYYIGTPILPEKLRLLSIEKQKKVILQGINQLGIPNEKEVPYAPDQDFAKKVRGWMNETGVVESYAVLLHTLATYSDVGPESKALIAGMEQRKLNYPANEVAQWLNQFAHWMYGNTNLDNNIQVNRG